jgi:hypothetical protein
MDIAARLSYQASLKGSGVSCRIIAAIVRTGRDGQLVTILWRLGWNDQRLSCAIYRKDGGLQLQLESASTVILTEPFEAQPRALARTQALRQSLKRRGWTDSPVGAGE